MIGDLHASTHRYLNTLSQRQLPASLPTTSTCTSPLPLPSQYTCPNSKPLLLTTLCPTTPQRLGSADPHARAPPHHQPRTRQRYHKLKIAHIRALHMLTPSKLSRDPPRGIRVVVTARGSELPSSSPGPRCQLRYDQPQVAMLMTWWD